MNEIKITINEQLQHLQMLMHRAMINHRGKTHSPLRGQGRVLAILKLKPEMSQKELTYLLNMSKQAAAELIVKLEKGGYITREPSEDDKRVMIIKLTEEGAKAATVPDDNAFETTKIFDCLNNDELTRLSEYLERIIKQYEAQFPDDDFDLRRQMMERFMSVYGHRHGDFERDFEHEHNHDYGLHGHNCGHGFGRFKNRGCGYYDDGHTETEHAQFNNGGNEDDKDDE